MNTVKYSVIVVFFLILAVAYLYFDGKGAYHHKIQSGKITAKVILPARSEMRGKVLHTTPKAYIFMVQKDSITERFEVSSNVYDGMKIGDTFTANE